MGALEPELFKVCKKKTLDGAASYPGEQGRSVVWACWFAMFDGVECFGNRQRVHKNQGDPPPQKRLCLCSRQTCSERKDVFPVGLKGWLATNGGAPGNFSRAGTAAITPSSGRLEERLLGFCRCPRACEKNRCGIPEHSVLLSG